MVVRTLRASAVVETPGDLEWRTGLGRRAVADDLGRHGARGGSVFLVLADRAGLASRKALDGEAADAPVGEGGDRPTLLGGAGERTERQLDVLDLHARRRGEGIGAGD